MLTIHPAIAAGVAANEDVARALDEAADKLYASGIRFDYEDLIISISRSAQLYVDAHALIREQMAIDRAANRTNRKLKRERGKARRRERLQALRRAKLSRWLGTVQESLAGARKAMVAEGWRPCIGCSMLTLKGSCATCLRGMEEAASRG